MNFNIFPNNTPKPVRILCYVTLGIFMLIGFALSSSFLRSSFGYFLLHLLYFFFIALIACVAIVVIWHTCIKAVRKATYTKLDADHNHSGWSAELAVIANNISPLPSPEDQAMTLFLKVMGEDYTDAEKYASHHAASTYPPRASASYYASMIRLAVMKGNFEKAHFFFREKSEMMDRAFEAQPDLQPEYRDYTDDALMYYQMAALLCLQTGETERAETYHRMAAFRLSRHCQSDQTYIPQLLGLAEQYAVHNTDIAYTLETQLRGEIEPAGASISPGCRSDYLRMLAQARLYANYIRKEEANLTERATPKVDMLKKDPAAGLLSSL